MEEWDTESWRPDGKIVEGRCLIASYIHTQFDAQFLDLGQSNVLLNSIATAAERVGDEDWDENEVLDPHTPHHEHLFVLVHGLSAFKSDLGFLEQALLSRGCHVLMSEANEFSKSFKGILECSAALVAEIKAKRAQVPEARFLSLVGNSFGGIVNRVAAKMLMEHGWLGLRPVSFMTIATPHLGVRFYTYVEETLGAELPFREHVVSFMSSLLSKTGAELLMNEQNVKDHETAQLGETLMYRIATERAYLDALASFRQRRAYGNLYNDSVVPLQTAVFLDKGFGALLRERHKDERGIVAIIVTERVRRASKREVKESVDTTWTTRGGDGGGDGESQPKHSSRTGLLEHMVACLDGLGWSKVLCHYPSVLPTAHSKLAAISRFPYFLHSEVFGFKEGEVGMSHAAQWLLLKGDENVPDGPPRMTSNPLVVSEAANAFGDGAIVDSVLHI